MKKVKQVKKVLRKIGFMFRFSWSTSPGIFFAGIFNIIIDSVEPFLLLILPKFIIDELVGGRTWENVLKYTLLYIGVFAACKVLRTIQNYGFAHIVNSCDLRTAVRYFNDFLHMDYEKLENDYLRNKFDVMYPNIHPNRFIFLMFVPTVTNILRLAGYTYIIASLHPLLIVLLLAIIGANALLSKRHEKINYEFEPKTARFNRMQSYLYNTMIGFDRAKETRINRAERWLHEKYDKTTSDFMKEDMKRQKKHLPLNVSGSLLSFAETFATYVYCAVRAIGGSITIGSFSVYTGAIANFSSSFNAVVQAFVHNSYVMKRIDDYDEYKQETVPIYTKTDPEISPVISEHPSIEFVNVSFKYPNTESYVLKDISLKIEGGKRLAIVGYNGAGKTTLIKLLCQLYEPTEGEILCDGINIRDIKYKDYMDILSVVFQDFKLFSFSAWENVTLNREVDSERLMYCIEQCGLGDKISSLPKGIDTSVGREFDEEGIEFSGGEGQKLASARALYKDGSISIMDEPTAALDPIAENELYHRFDNIIGEKTALYISHRLASARFCDRIAVFAHGEVVEEGTHDELMSLCGVYCEMFKRQAEYYREGEAV